MMASPTRTLSSGMASSRSHTNPSVLPERHRLVATQAMPDAI